MNYTENPINKDDFPKSTSTLINMGNLDFLFTTGNLYDQTQDDIYLQ